MSPLAILRQFLEHQAGTITLPSLLLALIGSGVLSTILGFIYVRFGATLSDRKRLSRTLPVLAMVTTLIIMVVKSSLALSLGLVGALSIVRFRAAIKEPEELVYLFFAIAVSLGFGADQPGLTSIAFIIICAVVIATSSRKSKVGTIRGTLILTVIADPSQLSYEQIVKIVLSHNSNLALSRMEQSGNIQETMFSMEADTFSDINAVKDELITQCPDARVTIVRNPEFA